MAIPRIRDIVLALPQRLASRISRDFFLPPRRSLHPQLKANGEPSSPSIDLEGEKPHSRFTNVANLPEVSGGPAERWREAATPSYLS